MLLKKIIYSVDTAKRFGAGIYTERRLYIVKKNTNRLGASCEYFWVLLPIFRVSFLRF